VSARGNQRRFGRFKGCCMMCAAHVRGEGPSRYQPVAVLRQTGRARRAVRKFDRREEW
jgi:hypothetical protein